MEPTRCYLCSGKLEKRILILTSEVDTVSPSSRRHSHCFRRLETASKQPAIQHSLLACTEPSRSADDKVAVHVRSAFRDTFVNFFTPRPGTVIALPVEIQHMIADGCYDSEFANSLRLSLVKDRTRAPSNDLHHVPVSLFDEVFIDYTDIDGLRYITSLKNTRNRADSHVLHLGSTDWTHITIGLDVFGCRTISLSPSLCDSATPWYRTISRSDVAYRQYVCIYQGRSVRDVVSIQDLHAPLFDIAKSERLTARYREPVRASFLGFEIPRMMRRSTANASGITVAFFAGIALDIHFHDNDQEGFEVFLRRLEGVNSSTVLRHAPIVTDERLVNIGARVPHQSPTTVSTACILFLTSKGKIIDLGPYSPGVIRKTYKTSWSLEHLAEIQTVFINKRPTFGAGAIIAVQSSHAIDHPISPQQPRGHYRTLVDERPQAISRRLMSPVFKDKIILENDLIVYTKVDNERITCKGFRNSTEEIGLSDKVVRGSQSLRLDNLDDWCLVDIREEEVCSVGLERSENPRTKMGLRIGLSLVLWTSYEGTIAEIRKWE